ncbi:DUF4253 domain-containing protein [Streptomyces sp. NPDC006879]|uniref:DUF4253 domain-containing protein n=1 Tax=Streptomyces sp. NPDC006879 TaxID=3364767 RepID=UPI003694658B
MTTPTNPLTQLAADPSGNSLGLSLPAGRLVDETYQGPWIEPLLWLAEAPAVPGEWAAQEAAWRAAGLHPVLIDVAGPLGGPEGWDLMCGNLSYPEDFIAEEVLGDYWIEIWSRQSAEDPPGQQGGDSPLGAPGAVAEVVAPFGPKWPGLAAAGRLAEDPDACAAEVADSLVGGGSRLEEPHLALVTADRSADIPAATGWTGSLNHEDDPGLLSAVLRGWEERFGTRVVALTADQVVLSVAAPVTDPSEAEAVAAEHFAFCPDNIGWGSHGTLRAYATQEVLGQRIWTFRWA